MSIEAYRDPNDSGNGPKWHTGKKCITPGCQEPAGTRWSPFWCFACNVKRIERIDRGFAEIGRRFDEAEREAKAGGKA